ncbi:uncharacterized protein KY384_007351 [Bacidia gigantensis]|uniref:uncharacterized protein n=1 Tax=Bacidia gigantensis TaxID=2732470 RepID=UPI001D055264|nr:uncharacterized protein KY384_007351 [Bacidia gigantensis]KAG8528433.1 hypothetical protein KY384_007351 [Bacidia gigantensis]
MKFGENLHQFQIVEWAPWYIDYRRLKRLYKQQLSVDDEKAIADLSDFQAALSESLDRFDQFYRSKLHFLRQDLGSLCEHYGLRNEEPIITGDVLELWDLTARLSDLHNAIEQLQYFAFINQEKILSKVSKFTGAEWSLDFSAQTQGLQLLKRVKDFQSRLIQPILPSACQTSLAQRKYIALGGDYAALNSALEAININDVTALTKAVKLTTKNSNILLSILLHRSITLESKDCFKSLIELITPTTDHLTRLLIIFRSEADPDSTHPVESKGDFSLDIAAELVRHLIDVMASTGMALLIGDSVGRTPLHYAVHYGLYDLCIYLWHCLRRVRILFCNVQTPAALLEDDGCITPLKLAIITGAIPITQMLLVSLNDSFKELNDPEKFARKAMLGEYLTIAVQLNSTIVVLLLVLAGADVNYKSHNNETTLYLATRSRKSAVVSCLFGKAVEGQDLDLNACEAINGWTALILACRNGDTDIVYQLLQAGADPTKRDCQGWTAKDHAAFKGREQMIETVEGMCSTTGVTTLSSSATSLDDYLSIFQRTARPMTQRQQADDLTSGHTQVFVNLGALDTDKPITAINLSPLVHPRPFTPKDEAGYLVEVCASDGNPAKHVITLPIMEDLANSPMRFTTDQLNSLRLAFNVYEATGIPRQRGSLIGVAIALLDSLKSGLGEKEESLVRNFTIPILKNDMHTYIGSVTFYVLIVKPLYPTISAPKQAVKLEDSGRTTIIGHRGTGENDPSRRQLQIGENTIEVQAFFTAPRGVVADCIEVIPVRKKLRSLIRRDVQVTKDDVPVIYHDFLVSETGIDAPIHALTLEQFMHISKAQSAPVDIASLAEKRYLENCGQSSTANSRRRSYSLNKYEQSEAHTLIERMKHTFEFKLNEPRGFDSYKGNIRSKHIQSSFMTLEEMFRKLPEDVSFDIEIKYPMLFEAHDWGMNTYALEVNHVVDTILSVVDRLAGNRTIFFSSFSPEICILLSRKQDVYPVFFLTEAGHIPSSDARADSLQAAIHFARAWNLPGIIARSQPFVMSPGLVKYVKDSGLQCISWGELNDEPEHAKKQVQAGLDAIIVNSIHLISKTLAEM